MNPTVSGSPLAEQSPGRPAARDNADYRWTPAKASAFMRALAEHGKVAEAARSVGMSRQSAYRLKRRVPQVAQVWQAALAAGRQKRLARGRRKVTVLASQGDGCRPAR